MTEEHIVTLVVAVIASGSLSTIIGWVLHHVDARHTRSPHDAALDYGVQTLLYQKLQQMHQEMICRGGWCTDATKQVADRVYNAYHSLGGNGTGTVMWQDIMHSHSAPRPERCGRKKEESE